MNAPQSLTGPCVLRIGVIVKLFATCLNRLEIHLQVPHLSSLLSAEPTPYVLILIRGSDEIILFGCLKVDTDSMIVQLYDSLHLACSTAVKNNETKNLTKFSPYDTWYLVPKHAALAKIRPAPSSEILTLPMVARVQVLDSHNYDNRKYILVNHWHLPMEFAWQHHFFSRRVVHATNTTLLLLYSH